jgi:Protein of unknown function (DUF3311)
MATNGETPRLEHARRARRWYLLLVLPFIGLLWVPLYAKATPKLWGFPFFYWYQFAWVPVAALLTYFVYTRTRR